ncbi:G2-specific serine/threonine protein kinase [Kalmusia sp. IMI 367209]|nr:G2-specific serine/threonine protein kinase [Kalmusia sp. IMI 367209]
MPEDEKYEVLEKIGHGSFGIIRKVKRKSDGYVLCRKEISYSKMSQKEKEQLQAELSILKELVHPNIVRYYEREHLKASQDLHLYMEYCGNGDLGRVIQNLKNKNQLAEEEFVWSIFSQIVNALYRCHYGQDPPAAAHNVMGMGADAKPARNGRPMILHRDLKPENIFLDHDNSVKLGDFGLSKILQSHDFASTYVGTPFYMSPEICKAEQYGPHSDIWALGCIIYEMCAKQPPFNARTHLDLIQKIRMGRYPPIPAVYSPELNKVIASCLQVSPTNRPDTAQLLNLPIVKLMRKEQEVVTLGQEIKDQEKRLIQREKDFDAKVINMRKEINDQLRREWEVKAHLEIEKRVKLEVERKYQIELKKLQDVFQAEVQTQVEKALTKFPARPSTSPKLAPRSNTPTQLTEQGVLFPSDGDTTIINGSTSTLGTNSEWANETDISSLSIEDSIDDVAVTKLAPKKRTRAPLTRARTMAAPASHPPPSPMDVQMGEPSPAPASLAGLSLSPRRNQSSRLNIFAAAKEGAKKWECEVPPSPTDDDWNADLDDDDTPALPSPTRSRSGSGGRNGHEDPFKVLAAAQKPLPKPTSRLASAPSLAPNGIKPRPHSAVPIVATSPSRPRSKPETTSPVRRAARPAENSGLLKKKVPINGARPLGRTLVELQQARGIPGQTLSEDEGKRGMRIGLKSPVKARSAVAVRELKPAMVWNPEECDDMPSPFIIKTRKNLVI